MSWSVCVTRAGQERIVASCFLWPKPQPQFQVDILSALCTCSTCSCLCLYITFALQSYFRAALHTCPSVKTSPLFPTCYTRFISFFIVLPLHHRYVILFVAFQLSFNFCLFLGAHVCSLNLLHLYPLNLACHSFCLSLFSHSFFVDRPMSLTEWFEVRFRFLFHCVCLVFDVISRSSSSCLTPTSVPSQLDNYSPHSIEKQAVFIVTLNGKRL